MAWRAISYNVSQLSCRGERHRICSDIQDRYSPVQRQLTAVCTVVPGMRTENKTLKYVFFTEIKKQKCLFFIKDKYVSNARNNGCGCVYQIKSNEIYLLKHITFTRGK